MIDQMTEAKTGKEQRGDGEPYCQSGRKEEEGRRETTEANRKLAGAGRNSVRTNNSEAGNLVGRGSTREKRDSLVEGCLWWPQAVSERSGSAFVGQVEPSRKPSPINAVSYSSHVSWCCLLLVILSSSLVLLLLNCTQT